jgi:hypothetical protein
MERQLSVFLRSHLKYFLWFCFGIVRVLFVKMGVLLGGSHFSSSLLTPFLILIHHASKVLMIPSLAINIQREENKLKCFCDKTKNKIHVVTKV